MAQHLQQQMHQISAASMWGNLTGLNSLGPQYLAVSIFIGLYVYAKCNEPIYLSEVHQFKLCCHFHLNKLFVLSPPGFSSIYNCCSSQPLRGIHSATCILFQVQHAVFKI